MKKDELREGKHYVLKLTTGITIVRLDMIQKGVGWQNRKRTTYHLTNIKTGRQTQRGSASAFRREADPQEVAAVKSRAMPPPAPQKVRDEMEARHSGPYYTEPDAVAVTNPPEAATPEPTPTPALLDGKMQIAACVRYHFQKVTGLDKAAELADNVVEDLLLPANSAGLKVLSQAEYASPTPTVDQPLRELDPNETLNGDDITYIRRLRRLRFQVSQLPEESTFKARALERIDRELGNENIWKVGDTCQYDDLWHDYHGRIGRVESIIEMGGGPYNWAILHPVPGSMSAGQKRDIFAAPFWSLKAWKDPDQL